MAAAASVLSKKQLLCAICLDVFSQPVSTPCGHNFCRDCIQRYWQSTNLPQCPLCKHKFYKKPDLKVNTFISEVASQFKQLREKKEEISAADQSTIQTTEVSCDVGIGKTVKVSSSETHLEPHHVLSTLEKHRLINPMKSLQERVCKRHDNLLDLFCVTDQMYVCRVCRKKDHKAHRTVSIGDESRKKRAQIRSVNVHLQELIRDRLQKICEINQVIQLSKRNTERELEESFQVFEKLLQIVQSGQEEVAEVIRAKQRQVQSRASGVLSQMEQEIDQLRLRSAELELLSHSDDDLYLLQSFPAIADLPAVRHWSDSCVETAEYVGTVRRAVRRVAVQLEETVKAEMSVEQPRRSLSPVLRAVVWMLLSCGILLAFCFLFFTMRFKNNRIVKMSSPNLNLLTLFGSVLTYISGFLFAVDEQAFSLGETSKAVMQARIWTLCVGSTLVFGPILGKTWRLYRVFTQRVPDKRVIIRDIQLIGMVALLMLVDVLVLTAWNLADPVRCSRSVAAVVKEMERDIFYSLSQLDSCSSVHSNIWGVIIAVKKGCLLLYGTYLAGLTSNVSRPPVNQSPTIITAVALVTVSSAVAVPVSFFLQAWPNLVCSTVAGAIFLCTLATNCMLFVPQLTQWRQFEEDQNDPSQMAKYFSSPSKSQPSAYSQDEIFYLLGENSSMKKLLTEKNAVIDSLQEQVNSAKDKLLRLMTESQPPKEQDVDSSATYLNSSSTQTTELQSEGTSSSSLSQRDSNYRLSASHLSPNLTAAPSSSNPPSSEPTSAPVSTAPASVSFPYPEDISGSETQRDVLHEPRAAEDVQLPVSVTFPGRTAEETVKFVTSLQTCRGLNSTRVETFVGQNGLKFLTGSNLRPTGFVSSEQLQEILQELSVDAVMETALRSPVQVSRTPSQVKLSTLSPLPPRTPCSPHPHDHSRYPCISPCMIKKRRPPFYSSRRCLAPPGFYTGPDVPGCRKPTDNCEHQNPESSNLCDTLLHPHNCTPEVEKQKEEGDADRQQVMRKCQRCFLRCYRCCAGPNHSGPGDMEEGGDSEQRHKHIRDSSGYWDSDSSSSTDYCYYHLPYCDSCLQRGSVMDSDSSSDSSDSEYDDYTSLYRSPRPVVFKDDLKPTFV
ncbi:uncharacterized protein gpr156 [Xenentodon cancila]